MQPAFAKKAPLVLAPSSKWIAKYEDDSCSLIRAFGTDDEKVILLLSRFGPGDGFRLTLGGKPVRLRAKKRPLSFQFGRYEREQKLKYAIGRLSGEPAIFGLSPSRIAPPTPEQQDKIDAWKPDDDDYILPSLTSERYDNAHYLVVGRPLRRSVILETGSLRKPFAAFDKCIEELLTHWGIDVGKHKTLSKRVRPKKNPGKWIRSSDYPKDMLRQGQSALVEFRLSIDKEGTATACHIQRTTRPKEFDNAVCRSLMKRSSFEPALDAEGNPIASYWRNRVRFQI